MTDSSTKKHELIYWPIRGLGMPLRAAFVFQGIDFTDNRTSDWFEENGTRSRLVKENNLPFANLPAVVLPDGTGLTQTTACLRYVASLGELKPRTPADDAAVDMILQHMMEFNAEKYKMTYTADALQNIPSFFEHSIPYYFGTLEKWMIERKTEFVATNYITVADLFLVEFICAFEKLKEGLDWMVKHPRLHELYIKVTNDPKLKDFYKKEEATPHNNPTAAKWF